MRPLLLLFGLALAMSLACGPRTDKDLKSDFDPGKDAESDTGSGADDPFAMNGFDLRCSGGACDYYIYTSAPAARFGLEMGETGVEAGWFESHTRFEADGEEGDSYVYRLSLQIVDDPDDQRANETTLLAEEYFANVTWLFTAEDENGDGDCVVTGHDPGYYSEICTRTE